VAGITAVVVKKPTTSSDANFDAIDDTKRPPKPKS
jgi:hypothetical protein